jgi:hypothetical protein
MFESTIERFLLDRISSYERELSEAVSAGGDGLEIWLKRQNETFIGSQNTSEDYKDRYLYELLQNSQDSINKTGRNGRVSIFVTRESLIVADEGCGLDIKSIVGILYLGGGNKTAEEDIGHKGLGLRSVLQLTRSPQFFQSETSFEFNEEKLRNRVADAIGSKIEDGVAYFHRPFLISAEECGEDGAIVQALLLDGHRLVIRLPFRSTVTAASVEALITTHLTSEILLFLPSISKLAVVTPSAMREIEIQFETDCVLPNGTTTPRISLIDGDAKTTWLCFTKRIRINSDLVRSLKKWSRVEHLDVSVAFRVDENDEMVLDEPRPVYSYFPTGMKTGFPFILHAPFYLSLNRNELHGEFGKELNKHLIDSLTTFAAKDAFPQLAELRPLSPKLLSSLSGTPVLVASLDPTGKLIRELIFELLRTERIVSNTDQITEMIAPDRALLFDGDFLSLGAEEVDHLIDKDFNSNFVCIPIQYVEGASDVLQELGAVVVDLDTEFDLLRILGNEDPHRYLRILTQWLRGSKFSVRLVDLLRTRKCLFNLRMEWITPSDGVFAFDELADYGFELSDTFEFVRVPLDIEGFRELLDSLGIGDLELRQILEGPVREMLRISGSTLQRANGLKLIDDFRIAAEGNLSIGSGFVLKALNVDGSDFEYRLSSELYFKSESDYDPYATYGKFGECDFVDLAELGIAGIVQTNDFLSFIGAHDTPRILPRRSGDNGPRIDRLEQLLEGISTEARIELWNYFLREWPKYQQYATYALAQDPSTRLTSQFMMTLRSYRWVPFQAGDEVRFSRPKDLWWFDQNTLPSKAVVRNLPQPMIPTGAVLIDQMMIQLQFCTLSKPQAVPLIDVLKRVAVEAVGNPKRVHFTIARWVLEELIRTTSAEEISPYLDDIFFVATLRGEMVFASRPLIVHDLRLAWLISQTDAVLDCDDTRASDYSNRFNLARIDDGVKAELGASDPDLTNELRLRLTTLLPFVKAIALKISERKVRDVESVFRSLDCAVVDTIDLVIDIDGAIRIFGGLTEYLGRLTDGKRLLAIASPGFMQLVDYDWEPLAVDLARQLEMVDDHQFLIWRLLSSDNEEERAREIAKKGYTLLLDENEDENDVVLPNPDEQSIDLWVEEGIAFTEIPLGASPRKAPDEPRQYRLEPPRKKGLIGGRGRPERIEDAEFTRPAPRLKGRTAESPQQLLQRIFNQRGTGNDAEEYVLFLENEQVQSFQRAHPEVTYGEPRRMSADVDDASSAWDIESYDESGEKLFIEVKGTSKTYNAPFQMSDSQVKLAEALGKQYFLYRIWDLDAECPQYRSYSDLAQLFSDGRASKIPLGYEVYFGVEPK